MLLYSVSAAMSEKSYPFKVINFRAQKFMSEINVMVVCSSCNLVIFIVPSVHIFGTRKVNIIFRIFVWGTHFGTDSQI